MPLADYAHWNEEAERIWWEEEGKHAESDAESCRDEDRDAEDAFFEELSEYDDSQLLELLTDEDYLARWPKAKKCIVWEAEDRGLEVPS